MRKFSSIEYTSNSNPTLTQTDGWTPLNFNKYYDGVAEAVGKVPPGGWSVAGTDVILNSSFLTVSFGSLATS